MVPVGTAAGDSWRPTISLCWSCRRTARSSIRSSGSGTIFAVTGSPTRCFSAWRTSWMPAMWPGPDWQPTTAWSSRSAQSLGPRLRPLYSCCLLSSRGLRLKHTHVRKYPESRISRGSTWRSHTDRVELLACVLGAVEPDDCGHHQQDHRDQQKRRDERAGRLAQIDRYERPQHRTQDERYGPGKAVAYAANARRIHFRSIGRHRPPHADEAPAPCHAQEPQGDLVMGKDPDRHEDCSLDQQYGKADAPAQPVDHPAARPEA